MKQSKRTIGIYEAKTSLSRLLKAVKEHGASFQISERGKPIALLSPIDGQETLDDRMNELALVGILELPEEDGIPQPIARRKGALRRFLEERE